MIYLFSQLFFWLLLAFILGLFLGLYPANKGDKQ